MISKLNIDIDYQKVLDTYYSLDIDSLLQSNLKQVAVQCRKDCATENQIYESCGSLFYDWIAYEKDPNGKLPIRKKIYKQNEFNVTCDFLKNTYIEEVITKIQKQYKVVRGRFMLMPHKTCLTYHTDETPRIHIPIYTNDNCMMIINDQVQRLPFGNTYFVDTTQTHTALNASKDPRVHLVFCVDMETKNEIT
jgi:hypothetical protein